MPKTLALLKVLVAEYPAFQWERVLVAGHEAKAREALGRPRQGQSLDGGALRCRLTAPRVQHEVASSSHGAPPGRPAAAGVFGWCNMPVGDEGWWASHRPLSASLPCHRDLPIMVAAAA